MPAWAVESPSDRKGQTCCSDSWRKAARQSIYRKRSLSAVRYKNAETTARDSVAVDE